jgi:hypothetical protein
MKKSILLSLVLFVNTVVFAQIDSTYLSSRLLKSADSLSWHFIQKDWNGFMRYTNPAIIGTVGGKEAFIEQVKARLGNIPSTAWKRYEPGRVLQLIKTDHDYQAILELHSVLEWQGMRIITCHALVAESWNGHHWTFFDAQNSPDIASRIKPDLDPRLIIPPVNQKMEPLQE